MKISISKTELVSALGTVIKATASRPSIPVLSGVLIDASSESISFFASDLETSIKTEALGLIEENGKVAVPCRILNDIIRALPDASVVLEKIGESLHISSQQTNFNIRTLDVADFSKFPDIDGVDQVTLPTTVVSSMVKKVSKSVSKDETRATLTGILMKVEGSKVQLVATDSYRLAIIENQIKELEGKSFEALIPGRAFDEVVKMASGAEALTITISSNQIKFTFGNTRFITRRLEGNYPNYNQLLPKEWTAKAIVSHGEFIDSVKRVSLLAINNAAIKISLSMENQDIILTSKSQDVGDAEEHIMVKVEGADREISINHSFLVDGLSVIDGEFVSIEIQESMKPGIIRSLDENFTYLVMPVRSN